MSLLVARSICVDRIKVNCGATFLSIRRARSAASTAVDVNDEDEFQYIQRSRLPTMHFQPSLPRLPIPQLEKTCERYLKAQQPLLIEEQQRHTQSCVSRFLAGEGPGLQKDLKALDAKNRHTSYITEYWFDMYLRDRKPLPINYNPLLVFVPEADPNYNGQLVKATNLLVSSLRFMKSLRAGILEPEVYHMNPKKSDNDRFRRITGLLPSSLSWYGAYLMKAFPLDMSQYSNLFNSTRIPELEKDMIYQDKTARHVVVMRRGHFYSFEVLDKNGYIHSPQDIASNLKAILEDSRASNQIPIGLLTTTERDEWAVTRHHLSELGNRDVLKTIDSAVLVLILDDESVGNDYKKLVRAFLHGDGTNRWFDKSFTLIVGKDGTAGVNFEHSWGDGVAVLRYFQDVKKDITEKPRFHPDDLKSIPKESTVERLSFATDSRIEEAVKQAKQKYTAWTDQLGLNYLIYDGFGKRECKGFGVSPDAVMQLAFQLAFYKQEGNMTATYESCSTSAFRRGRTETIRPCTAETKALCEAIADPSNKISTGQLKQMIIDCSNTHNRLTKEAAMGQGFDRHLFGLKRMWEKLGTQKPAIFEDPAYEALNHNVLSTSTLSSPAVAAGGFGPVVQDGYGIGYMIQDSRLGAVVTSYQGYRNGDDYISSLESSFKDIHRILLHK